MKILRVKGSVYKGGLRSLFANWEFWGKCFELSFLERFNLIKELASHSSSLLERLGLIVR